MSINDVPVYAVSVSWLRPDVSPRGLWITDPLGSDRGAGEPVADAPLPGTGAPTRRQCDHLLATLGYRRTTRWEKDLTGRHAWVESTTREPSA